MPGSALRGFVAPINLRADATTPMPSQAWIKIKNHALNLRIAQILHTFKLASYAKGVNSKNYTIHTTGPEVMYLINFGKNGLDCRSL